MSDTTTDPTTVLAGTAATAPSPITPYLVVAGGAAAIDWYRDAFGAIETLRFADDDGTIGHAELAIGGGKVMLADEFPDLNLLAPGTRGGTTVTLHLEVADVDHTHRRSVESGATSERAPADQGHGNRTATIVDPFGHRWMLSQPVSAERAAAADEPGTGSADATTWAVTDRRPVEPGYLTFATPDLARARAFYGALFDWDIVDGNVDGGGHIENTRFPMGFFQQDDPGTTDGPAATTVYFRVDDLDPYLAKVTELGGQVLTVNEYASGPNAECVDDQGRRFDLFRPAPGY